MTLLTIPPVSISLIKLFIRIVRFKFFLLLRKKFIALVLALPTNKFFDVSVCQVREYALTVNATSFFLNFNLIVNHLCHHRRKRVTKFAINKTGSKDKKPLQNRYLDLG